MVSRRRFLGVSFSGGAGVALGRTAPRRTPRHAARVVDLVQRTQVVDMLSLLTLDWPRCDQWRQDPSTFTADDERRLRASGITVFHPAVGLPTQEPYADVRRWLEEWNRLLAAHPRVFLRVDRADDIRRAKASGRIGVLLGMQDSHHFRTAADVDEFHALGQRVSQLTYNGPNPLGTGCTEASDAGLTPYGAEVIRRMEQVGMAVDVSHCGPRTTLDAIGAARKPVLITHANCRALVPHQPRCKSDEAIRALAARGGVMGITCLRPFVHGASGASLAHVLDHFDHVARLVGVEHVGVGSDTDLERMTVQGLGTVTRMYDLAAGLLGRGYGEGEVELMLGGNFRRVLGEVLGGGVG